MSAAPAALSAPNPPVLLLSTPPERARSGALNIHGEVMLTLPRNRSIREVSPSVQFLPGRMLRDIEALRLCGRHHLETGPIKPQRRVLE